MGARNFAYIVRPSWASTAQATIKSRRAWGAESTAGLELDAVVKSRLRWFHGERVPERHLR